MENHHEYEQGALRLCRAPRWQSRKGKITRWACHKPHWQIQLTSAAFQIKPLDDKTVIPQFEVYDDSSVLVKESSNTLESSMVHNGFSSKSFEAGLYVLAACNGFTTCR